MKIRLTIIAALAFTIIACENQDIEFEDFGSTAVYFPYQTPVRTLIQGKYDLGFNDNDNKGRFEIGVNMSGIYNNDKDRKVFFELAPDLINSSVIGVDSVNVKVLPSDYFTIEQESPVIIPAGSHKGRIPIQLNDAFFDDSLSFAEFGKVHYVVPLLITRTEEIDSLLTGVPLVDYPVKVRSDDWEIQPKDYTLFGIKFMNKYQGKYLRRGEDKIVGSSEVVKTTIATGVIETQTTDIDTTTVYRNQYVVKDEVTDITTAGRNKAISTNFIRRAGLDSSSTVSLLLTFNDNDEITITNADEDSVIVIENGSGRFLEDGDEWGGERRDVIYLEYEYQDKEVSTVPETSYGTLISETTTTVDLTHTVKDTLVIRDRNVTFEEFVVELNE